MSKKRNTIQIRIDGDVKKKARKVFGSVGLDMSSAIELFLKASIRTGSIPFSLESDVKVEIPTRRVLVPMYRDKLPSKANKMQKKKEGSGSRAKGRAGNNKKSASRVDEKSEEEKGKTGMFRRFLGI